MPDVSIVIEGMDNLQRNLDQFPSITKKRINDALKASIFEIQKRTDDSGGGGLFQFKTPRALRTGYLARSFIFGIKYADWYASIGPTADYADFVYYGTRGGPPNNYIDRIAQNAKPDIDKQFKDAGDLIVSDIAKI